MAAAALQEITPRPSLSSSQQKYGGNICKVGCTDPLRYVYFRDATQVL